MHENSNLIMIGTACLNKILHAQSIRLESVTFTKFLAFISDKTQLTCNIKCISWSINLMYQYYSRKKYSKCTGNIFFYF